MTKKTIDDLYEFCLSAGITAVTTSNVTDTTLSPNWNQDLERFIDPSKFALQMSPDSLAS